MTAAYKRRADSARDHRRIHEFKAWLEYSAKSQTSNGVVPMSATVAIEHRRELVAPRLAAFRLPAAYPDWPPMPVSAQFFI